MMMMMMYFQATSCISVHRLGQVYFPPNFSFGQTVTTICEPRQNHPKKVLTSQNVPIVHSSASWRFGEIIYHMYIIYICKYIDIVYAMYLYIYIYILLSPSSIHHFLPIIFDFWEIHPSIHPAVIPFKNLWGLSTTGCCEWIGPLEGLSSMSLTTIFPHKGHDGHHGHRPEDMGRSLQGMMQLKTLRISRMWGGEIWLWKFGTLFGGIAGRKHNWSSSKFAQWNPWNYRRS